MYCVVTLPYSWYINPEAFHSRYSDDICCIHSSIKAVHGKGWRTINDTVSRVQNASHQQVNQLITATPYLWNIIQGLVELVSKWPFKPPSLVHTMLAWLQAHYLHRLIMPTRIPAPPVETPSALLSIPLMPSSISWTPDQDKYAETPCFPELAAPLVAAHTDSHLHQVSQCLVGISLASQTRSQRVRLKYKQTIQGGEV